MSDAARRLVEAWTHPKVKGSARSLLEKIAELIPEGETMTPPLADPDLAASIGYDKRTARYSRAILVDAGVIRVVGGGRGRKASYELLLLTGAGAPPALPLRADLRSVVRKSSDPERRDPDLFNAPVAIATLEPAHGERLAPKVGSFFLRVVKQPRKSFPTLVTNVGHFFLRCRNVGHFFLRWGSNVGHFFLRWLPLDGTRARGTYNNLRTTTTTAAAVDAPTETRATPRRCRWHGGVHAWCDGRVHVPMDFHVEERRKLARRPGQTDADLDAQLFPRYAEVLAAIPETEKIRDKNEFAFWNRVLRSAPQAGAPTTTRARSLSRPGARDTYCPHEPCCRSFATCRALLFTEARAQAARERQTG